jgi:hypothetical protein
MKRRTIFLSVIIILIIISLIVTRNYDQVPQKTGTANLNGTNLYYEIYGKGEPMILLHGWTQSSQYWIEFIKEYSKKFEVYVLD